MGIFKASSKGSKEFVQSLRPGDSFVTLDVGSLNADEEVDSKEITKFARGQTFLIQKFGNSDMRALVTNVKDQKEQGWISVETRKGVVLVGPVPTDERKVAAGPNSAVPTKLDKAEFIKSATVGTFAETLYHVTVRKDQEMDSAILFELGAGVPFKIVQRTNDASRRCKVQLFTKNNRTGWVSLETRKGEALVRAVSKKNRIHVVDVSELVKEYEVGQVHEVQTALRVEESEESEESLNHFYLQPGEKVQIEEISSRVKMRANIKLLSNKKSGWITLIQDSGEFTIGKSSGKQEPHSGMWKSATRAKVFLFAARDGNVAQLKELSEVSKILGSSVPINTADAQGKTALIYASAFGRVDCCVYLLTRPNVEVNALDTFNRTALHHACKIGNYRIVELLVKSGANVNARDFKGHVPLMQLAVVGDMHADAYKCASFLLRNQAIPTVLDYNGVGAIDFAASVQDSKMVQLLQDAGAPRVSGGQQGAAKATTKNKRAVVATKEMKQEENRERWEAESDDDGGDPDSPTANVEKSPKEEAVSRLEKAMESSDVMEMTNAIEGAVAVGIDAKEAEKRLQEMKEVLKAEEWMESCLDETPPDIPKLKDAMVNCKKARVPQEKMDKWQKQIDKLIPAYEAHQALEKAAQPENMASLEKELKKAEGVLTATELAPYKKKQDEYNNFDAAMKSLKDSFQKKDIVALADLVKSSSALKKRMSSEQKKLHEDAEALVAKEMPKIEAREKVQNAINQNPDSAEYISNLDKVAREVLKLGLIDKDPTMLKALQIVKGEKERTRLRAEFKKVMEDTKVFSKVTEVDKLQQMKDTLSKLVNESRHPDVNLPEMEVAPVALRLRKVHNQVEDLKGSIRIYFRARPLSQNEKDQGGKDALKYGGDGMTIIVLDEEEKESKFQLDNVFNPGTQAEVFDEVKDLVQSCFDGYNVTLFAYGQTGSGKTYTMYGKGDDPGVVPRVLKNIFVIKDTMEKQCQVTVIGSMIELYRADFNDLLSTKDPKMRPQLSVRLDKKGEVYVENAVEEQMMTSDEVQNMIDRGFGGRAVAATLMNSESSRGHLIVLIKIIIVNNDTNETIKGKIILVDLAGSERMKKSGVQGDALKEAIEINKSLTALGDVIEQLTSGQKTVGYRNHKLTQIMQDSIGGSAKTLMFCNCSPATINVDETIMTLKWATRAKQVTNTGPPKAKAKAR